MPVLFCHIAWMNNYAGRNKQDPPLGGGSFVEENGYAHEECNFVSCDDGFFYGHFETRKGDKDRQVAIERLGANKDDKYLDGVDIVWTAPKNGTGVKTVVGWYRNARLYRERQNSSTAPPSSTHAEADIDTYRVKAFAKDCVLLPTSQRIHDLGTGKGWSGQASWWYAEETINPAALKFAQFVKDIIQAEMTIRNPSHLSSDSDSKGKPGRRAGKAASKAYTKFLENNEIQVHPHHNVLEKFFKKYIKKNDGNVAFPDDCYRDDLRIRSQKFGDVMVELKPADKSNVRYAIRTAMGQLLDYKQDQMWKGKLLIVVGTNSLRDDDWALAISNGFGLATQVEGAKFNIRWPKEPKR